MPHDSKIPKSHMNLRDEENQCYTDYEINPKPQPKS